MKLSLKMKLGSLTVHADEFISPDAHEADRAAIKSLLIDPEVNEFLDELRKDALIPVKRK